MHIAVAGGTGLTGRHVVAAAEQRGHEVRVLARTRGVDLIYGQGVTEALEGMDAVIDVSNSRRSSRRAAEQFFGRATSALLAGARLSGVHHLVALSIVNCDRVDLGYYFGKRRQEQLIRDGDVPWTVLRATQFHEFCAQLAGRVPGPVLPVPIMRTRPVASADVAAALVDLAEAGPAHMAGDMAGPEVLEMPDMTRRWLQAGGQRRAVVPVRVPGSAGAAMADDGLLPNGEFRAGSTTFADWLAGGATAAAG